MENQMKCGPDDCPIVAFSDLTPAEQRVQRKRTAEKMYKQGFTQEQIAKQLGVSQNTISLDLGNLSTIDKSKPAKTTANPKGAGRPKGSNNGKSAGGGRKGTVKPRNQTVVPEDRPKLAAAVLDHGQTVKAVAADAGVSEQIVKTSIAFEQGRRAAEPLITPDMLSMTAQEKLAAALRQQQKALDVTFHARVNARVQEFVEATILPQHRKEQDMAKRVMNARKGVMDKDTFTAIRRALHPDSRNSISDKKLAEAFDKFMALEKLLLDEKASQTEFSHIPTNWDDLKQRVSEKRKAARNSSHKEMRYR